MSFGTILFGSIVGTMIALREELSGPPTGRPASLFPPCSTEKQVALLQRMRETYDLEDYAASLSAAQGLLKDFPNCPYLYMYRGMCYGQTDRYEEAIEDFITALSLDNASDAGKTYWLGHNRNLILGDLHLARSMKLARDRAIAEMEGRLPDGKPDAKPGKTASRPKRGKKSGTRARSGEAKSTDSTATSRAKPAGSTGPRAAKRNESRSKGRKSGPEGRNG